MEGILLLFVADRTFLTCLYLNFYALISMIACSEEKCREINTASNEILHQYELYFDKDYEIYKLQ